MSPETAETSEAVRTVETPRSHIRLVDRLLFEVLQAWPLLSLLIGVGVIVALVELLSSVVVQDRVTNALVDLVVVVGLYTFSGNSGILSFGHISFMTIGAYASALLTIPSGLKHFLLPDLPPVLTQAEMGFMPAALFGVLIAGGFAAVASVPVLRFSGVQASLVTMAMLIIVHNIALNWDSVTKGSAVITGIPNYTDINVAMVGAFIALLIGFLYQRSRFGRRLRASSEDAQAAAAIGISVVTERRIAFILSACLCAFGGALWAHYVAGFNPDAFYFDISFVTISMLIIGGLRSLAGAAAGTVVVSLLTDTLRAGENSSLPVLSTPGISELGLAAAMLLILIFRPRGLTAGKEVPLPGRLARKRAQLRKRLEGEGAG